MKHDKLIINSNGKVSKKHPFAKRMVFPTFEIYSNPTIKISDIKLCYSNQLIIGSDGKVKKSRKRRFFNVIDRAVRKARQEIMRREDEAIFRALDSLGESGNKEE